MIGYMNNLIELWALGPNQPRDISHIDKRGIEKQKREFFCLRIWTNDISRNLAESRG